MQIRIQLETKVAKTNKLNNLISVKSKLYQSFLSTGSSKTLVTILAPVTGGLEY